MGGEPAPGGKLVRIGILLIVLAISFPAISSLSSEAEMPFLVAIGQISFILFYFCSFLLGLVGAIFLLLGVAIKVTKLFNSRDL
jgi:hypothetical protein